MADPSNAQTESAARRHAATSSAQHGYTSASRGLQAVPKFGDLHSISDEAIDGAFAIEGGHWRLTTVKPEATYFGRGRKGYQDTSVGQDSVCIAQLQGGWELIGVFDGHGLNGDWPSGRAIKVMPYLLQEGECADLLGDGKVEQALQEAFKRLQNYLIAEAEPAEVRLQSCGSTATVTLHHPSTEEIWVATLGDSRAVLFDLAKGVLNETSDHKPNRPDEAERITSMGGEVVSVTFDDEVIHRVCARGGKQGRGLAVSRAFGDLSVSKCGVIAEPEIVRWTAPPGSTGIYLLVCSDGVWEHIKSRKAVQIVYETLKSEGLTSEAAERLLKAATTAWARPYGGGEEPYCDDISLVLAPIKGPHKIDWMEAKRQLQQQLEESGCVVS